ncbi:MAG TPA: hypothetical protein VGL12_04815 [Roseiarcus sp.]
MCHHTGRNPDLTQIRSRCSDPSTSALGYADRQTNRTDVLDLLGSYKSTANALGSDNTNLINAITASTAGDLKAFQPNGVAKKEAASTRQTGTSVSVANGASMTAGGSILMAAGQTIRTNITAGGGAIGIVGLGGSVAILNVNQPTVVNFDGVASAGGDFLVSAAMSASENVHAFGGQAGLVARRGAGCSVVGHRNGQRRHGA